MTDEPRSPVETPQPLQPPPARARIDLGPTLVFGVLITVVGVALMLDRLGMLDARLILRYWPVGIILYGLSLIAQAFWPSAEPVGRRRGRGFASFFFAMMILGLVIGPRIDRQRNRTVSGSESSVSLFGIMSEDRRAVVATEFKGGDMTSVMGATDLDLREATLAPGQEVTIDIFTVMGGAIVRVPPGWVVDIRAVTMLGGSDDRRGERTPAENGSAPRLVLRGLVLMGGLTIRS